MTTIAHPQDSGRPMRDRIQRAASSLRHEWLRSTVMLTAVAVIGWLVLYPLGILFEMGFRTQAGQWTLQNFVEVFTEPGLAAALRNSLIVSTATTIVALLFGVPMAWAVTRTRMPGRGLLRVAVLIAFVTPNFITVIAWILLLGPNAGHVNVLIKEWFGVARMFNVYSTAGLVFVLSCSFYPLIFFATAAALDNMDPSYEEAAQMVGASSWRGSLGIAIPLVLPAIVSSSVFVFLEAMGAFGAPAALGNAAHFHTLTTKIYELFSYPPRFELAAAAATPIIFFTFLGLWLQRWVVGRRRYTVIGGKSRASAAVDIGWKRWLLFAYCWLIVFVSVVLPLSVLLRTSLLSRWGMPFNLDTITLKNYIAISSGSSIVPTALVNSFLVSAGTATIAVLLGIVIVWLVERTTMPGRGLLTFISTVTFAFPGVALAVGFVLGYSSWPLALFGTIWLYFIAFTAHRFPFAFMFLRNSVKQMSSELEEAGRMSGATWGRALIDISVPLLKTGMIAAWMMVFAVTLRELSMAVLLYVRGTETLPVAIYSFIDNGTFEIAAAVSILLIALTIVSMVTLRLVSGKAHMEL